MEGPARRRKGAGLRERAVSINPEGEALQRLKENFLLLDYSRVLRFCVERMLTPQKYWCFTRPPGLGKTAVLDLLSAYFGAGESTPERFCGIEAAGKEPCISHFHQYDVLRLNVEEAMEEVSGPLELRELLREEIARKVAALCPGAFLLDPSSAALVMGNVYLETRRFFVVLIDDWDAPYRRWPERTQELHRYVDCNYSG